MRTRTLHATHLCHGCGLHVLPRPVEFCEGCAREIGWKKLLEEIQAVPRSQRIVPDPEGVRIFGGVLNALIFTGVLLAFSAVAIVLWSLL